MKEYLFCPRSFSYRKLHHLSLITSINSNVFTQDRIDAFTSGFFFTLSKWNEETSPKTRYELEYLLSSKFFTHLENLTMTEDYDFRELDEKVFTLLSWLIVHLWEKNTPIDEQLPYYLPLMVNEFIQAPGIHLQGRPSAVFRHPNDKALILIQTFHQKFPNIKNGESLQASLYARILQTMEINPQDYLFVNYHRMDLKFQRFKQSDLDSLDSFLNDFRIAMREGNFDPPENPPCIICEFKWICKD